jgi:hypothetical protein
VFGAAFDKQVARALRVEAALAYFRDSTQFTDPVSNWYPEVGAYLTLPSRVAPYGGAGVGLSRRPSLTDFTVHGAAGLHAAVAGAWGLRAELRVRAVDPFVGTTADFTVGVSYRVGR